MESNLLTLSKIFTERLFRIPDYQRGYAWTNRQLHDFWNDLIQLEKNKNHYTGVLTLEDVPEKTIEEWKDDRWIIEHKSFFPHYIVDGQQRLTTSIILIQSIVEKAQELRIQTLNYTSLDEIRKKFIFDTKDMGISRSYIFGYETDNPSYEYLKTKIFLEKSDSYNPIQETIYTQNLIKAKSFFSAKLSNLNRENLELIFKKLTQHLLFNIYTISNDIDTFVSFETMNNRGKPLSDLELLKNRLIYLSTKLIDDDFERKSLRKRINECWKSIYHNLGRNKDKPLDDDDFLVNHFVVYFNDKVFPTDNPFNLPVTHYIRFHRYNHSNFLLEKVFTTKNITINNLTIKDLDNYVENLKESVELWYKIHNPSGSFSEQIDKWLLKINRLGIEDVSSIIMTFFRIVNDEDARLDFLKAIERLLFIHSLAPREFHLFDWNEVNFYSLAFELQRNNLTYYEIIKKINNTANQIFSNEQMKVIMSKKFGENGFYHWSGIRYFFFEYDLWLFEQSKTDREKLIWETFKNYDYESIEHIYPQNAKSKCWTSVYSKFNHKQKKILRNSLGNLLPLSKPKNSSLSNKCFKAKISNNNNKVGYRYGCYAENEITEFNQWTEKQIMARGLNLVKFMEKRWNLRIGNEQEKISFLGLSFLQAKGK